MRKYFIYTLLLSSFTFNAQVNKEQTIVIHDSKSNLTESPKEGFRKNIAKLSLELKGAVDKADLYRQRAMTYFLIKEYDAAVNDFSRVIELDSTDAESYIFRGFSKQFSAKSYAKTGCEDIAKAKQLGYTKADWNSIGVGCPGI